MPAPCDDCKETCGGGAAGCGENCKCGPNCACGSKNTTTSEGSGCNAGGAKKCG